MSTNLPPWVEKAAALPVAFAQVREDPLLDLAVVEQLGSGVRVTMVASGGCTAALLATSPRIASLQLVDPNPAQLALTRLKLSLLQSKSWEERLALLGHWPMPMTERKERLAAVLQELQLSKDALGPIDFVAEVGPDHAGRYERAFAALREALADSQDQLEDVLRLRDPAEQSRQVDPSTSLGQRLDEALDAALALPNLVRLFGQEATNNPVEPFSRHFARRIRHALATLPAADNPYIWQMLRGSYTQVFTSPWFDFPPAKTLPEIAYVNAFMIQALGNASTTSDFVHLSNILDWLTPEEATRTLQLVASVLRPGGVVFIRQLNSTLDIPSLGPQFEWLPTEELHGRDRSFFYRALHLGRRR